jgi:ABC-type dipeptide/oligopeptide/nickel transport system ATPase component
MAQRVMIAMALSCDPELIIADEPTTALDVTTQLKILQMIVSLQKEVGFSLLLISHDLNMVSKIADYIAIMKNGEIIESNNTNLLLSSPQKFYTKQLLSSFNNTETFIFSQKSIIK